MKELLKAALARGAERHADPPSTTVVKTCLIVSPHFPPSTLAGVHRARHLLKHLPAHGWRAKIVCVDTRHHIERLDPALAALVAADAPIIRVGALPASVTRPLGVAGDIGLRGLGHIRAAIARELQAAAPDIVMITGSPYYPMLLSRWVRSRRRTPVVLDFQDPWVSREGARQAVGSKAWLAHRLAVALEPIAVRHASFITSVSDRQNEEMAERYPRLDPSRMAAIPIGGDPTDFEALSRTSGRESDLDHDSLTRFSYLGTALPRSGPLLRVLFKGLAILRDGHPQLAARLMMQFIGTSNQPNDSTTLRVLPIAEETGVAGLVREQPARVPYLDALRVLSTSHAILMIGSDETHYTASKIYPGLMSGRPFLSLFHRTSSAHTILSGAGGGIALAFETPEELDALPPQVADALLRLSTDPESLGRADPLSYADYTAHAIAGRFAAIFDEVQREAVAQRETTA